MISNLYNGTSGVYHFNYSMALTKNITYKKRMLSKRRTSFVGWTGIRCRLFSACVAVEHVAATNDEGIVGERLHGKRVGNIEGGTVALAF
jgi:hypothetical protein